MAYSIEFEARAIAELTNVPTRYYGRVVALIDALEQNPYPPKSKQMNDPLTHLRRIRLEKWRVVYAVNEEEKIVTIVKVGEKAGTGTEFYEDLE